jgi:hypothetical protein
MRAKKINLTEIQTELTPGEVKVILWDGHENRLKVFNASSHGKTIIETVKNKPTRVTFEESELL